jgi:tRNA pseudouridine13 synthase
MFSAVAVRLTRQQRGLYLSAARSLLFNKVLAHRVASGSWNHSLPGERLLLDASRNSFVADSVDAEVLQRLASLEIHPSGPLWGKGDPPVGIEVGRLESEILAPLGQFRQGLEMVGLNQERRALRARISDLDWSIAGDQLELSFYLPKGSYATALLRECLDYRLAME